MELDIKAEAGARPVAGGVGDFDVDDVLIQRAGPMPVGGQGLAGQRGQVFAADRRQCMPGAQGLIIASVLHVHSDIAGVGGCVGAGEVAHAEGEIGNAIGVERAAAQQGGAEFEAVGVEIQRGTIVAVLQAIRGEVAIAVGKTGLTMLACAVDDRAGFVAVDHGLEIVPAIAEPVDDTDGESVPAQLDGNVFDTPGVVREQRCLLPRNGDGGNA